MISLLHYLRALGVLRVVAMQKDPEARLWFEGDTPRFLATAPGINIHGERVRQIANWRDIEVFFCQEYKPTPILSPWNGGSGFYPGDTAARARLAVVKQGGSRRFEEFRRMIAWCEGATKDLSKAQDGEGKARLIRRCHNEWTGPALDWVTAATEVADDGSIQFPALLGSGGNEGRFDISTNFLKWLLELFDPSAATEHEQILHASGNEPVEFVPGAGVRPQAAAWLRHAFGLEAIAHSLPRGSFSFLQAANEGEETPRNPWDFVLAMEGACALGAGAHRRLEHHWGPAGALTAENIPAGYSTAVEGEKTRGEVWLPLWESPATFAEVRGFLRNGMPRILGRAPTGADDMALAIALGGLS
ncbi:type I-U CRISPR-associated protein Csx17 [Pendulispora rubella]|uniref:Type I-U CRISPR-associated protein Csx17 n=1 Tax=Pendulispora rubella TaxID=2741070 RepID=A0ABZ2KTL4_9BACT